jgi:hypothetical protein
LCSIEVLPSGRLDNGYSRAVIVQELVIFFLFFNNREGYLLFVVVIFFYVLWIMYRFGRFGLLGLLGLIGILGLFRLLWLINWRINCFLDSSIVRLVYCFLDSSIVRLVSFLSLFAFWRLLFYAVIQRLEDFEVGIVLNRRTAFLVVTGFSKKVVALGLELHWLFGHKWHVSNVSFVVNYVVYVVQIETKAVHNLLSDDVAHVTFKYLTSKVSPALVRLSIDIWRNFFCSIISEFPILVVRKVAKIGVVRLNVLLTDTVSKGDHLAERPGLRTLNVRRNNIFNFVIFDLVS